LQQAVLAETLNYYNWFLQSSVDDPELRGAVALTRLEIARLRRLAGTFSDADEAYAMAVSDIEAADQGRANTQDMQLRLLHAQALNEWAILASEHGLQDQAAQRLALARTQLESLLQSDAKEIRRSALLASALTHNNRGVVYLRDGQSEPGIGELQAAIALLSSLPPADPRQPQAEAAYISEGEALQANINLDLADAFSNLSALMSDAGRYAEAASAAEQSIALRASEGLLHSREQSERLAVTQNNLAALYWKAETPLQAIHAYERAIELLERSMRRSPARMETRNRLAVTLNNLGMALFTTQQLTRAEQIFNRATMLAEAAVDSDPRDAQASRRLAGIQNNLAVLLRDQGRVEEAEQLFERAMRLIEASEPDSGLYDLDDAALHKIKTNYNALHR
jgi:tetratricopeptide (TPR) repeat protein